MRLLTIKTCPFLLNSKLIASRIISISKVCTSVCTGYLLGGGVEMVVKSREPINENCSVRGIGVAVIVSVSTFIFNCFNFSFTETPNFCSSSIISKPRSLNSTSLPTNRCVPISMSILPSFKSESNSFCSFDVRALLK